MASFGRFCAFFGLCGGLNASRFFFGIQTVYCASNEGYTITLRPVVVKIWIWRLLGVLWRFWDISHYLRNGTNFSDDFLGTEVCIFGISSWVGILLQGNVISP